MGTSIRGTAVRRVEDPHFLTGDATYIDNLTLPGALQVVYVRSVVPHARITSIDVSDALAVPGVVAVYTWPDLGIDLQRPLPFADRGMSRALLAHDVVRFVGEPVAAVLAETRSIAVDAAELVVIDYDALPAVVEVEDALLDEIVLFPEVGTNVAARAGEPTDETLFAGCEVVVECRIVQPRLAPAPLEVRTATSLWESGRLTQWSCSQGAHGAKANLVRFLGVSPDDVRVIVPDVGGGFGAKVGFYPEELLNALFARMLDRPVHWVETRTENLVGMFHGRAQVQHARLGGGRDGTLLAYELEIVQDCGAYPSIGPMMPGSTILMASGAYRIPNVGARAVSVATNTTPVGAYRGAGRPEATAAIERMIDLYAAEIGMDSADLRFRNLIASDSFPYETPTGACYDSGNYAGALDKLLATAQYEELRAEQRRLRATDSPTVLGIGISVYVEVTNRMGAGEFAAIEVTGGGGAIVHTGSSAHGQGHATAWAMIAADVTGIEMEDIEVRFGDTDEIPRGGGTHGSRSLQVGGAAVHAASEELVELGRKLAAEQL
ncbi:MAG: xanthine dehydrogenase family protein molybdopterin-binding subunit, partial [Mycobacterium sp.]